MSVLDTIVEHRKARVRAQFSSLTDMERMTLLRCGRDARPQEDLVLLRDRRDVGVVAEVKKASPSEGPIAPECSAAKQARRYVAGGAAAISVLTEPEYFGGSFADLSDAVDAVHLPMLCKDIVVDPIQLYMARASGADAVLLMISVLGTRTRAYVELAWELGLGPIIEVANLDELDHACTLEADVVAVNARDLHTLEVDTVSQLELVSEAAYCSDLFVIAASGIRARGDVEAAADAGADAVLVGTSLMRSPAPEDAVRELTGVPKRSKR
ncbi:MAG: indole-3-glycerol-phosphate synthase [Coriobacteriia bacterium]|nr:indole-3-glycerol-phosphate synthase [Coriobacteriia bacterium]MBN2847023.1 indole-3-glycerol-phosphate synthase [Coriobacteriia bacterium]